MIMLSPLARQLRRPIILALSALALLVSQPIAAQEATPGPIESTIQQARVPPLTRSARLCHRYGTDTAATAKTGLSGAVRRKA